MKLLPTWKNLILIINQLNLVDLAQRMKTQLRGKQPSEMTASAERQVIMAKEGEKT